MADAAELTAGVDVLERATSYALGAVAAVTPRALSWPTPCAGWDVRTLLDHVNDSLEVLRAGIESGRVGPPWEGPAAHPDDSDLVAAFRDRAGRLVAAWAAAADGKDRALSVAGHPLMASVAAGAGAIEIAVHGWDIRRACGRPTPIPAALATEILVLAPLVVSDGIRTGLFAAPVPVTGAATPGDRLVAFLGRDPWS